MERIKHNLELLPKSITGHFTLEHVPLVQQVCDLVKPSTILEFGFNVGHSAVILLEISDCVVLTSYDPSEEPVTIAGANLLSSLYKGRFQFKNQSSARAKYNHAGGSIDLLLVDGDHSHAGCLRDLGIGFYLGVKYLLVDDYNGQIKDTVREFIQDFPYTIDNIYSEGVRIPLALLKRE